MTRDEVKNEIKEKEKILLASYEESPFCGFVGKFRNMLACLDFIFLFLVIFFVVFGDGFVKIVNPAYFVDTVNISF